MRTSMRSSVSGIPRKEWTRPDLPDARTALYQLLRGERMVLFRAEGFLVNWEDRTPVRTGVRSMALRLGLKVSINWVGSIQDGENDRTVWQITRMTG